MSFLTCILILYVLISISLYKVFEKADKPGWHALVPGLNFVTWAEIVGRTKAHAAWMLFPIVNIFIFAGLAIDLVRSFGKLGFWDSFLAVVIAPISFGLLGIKEEEKYEGPILPKERAYKEKMEAARKSGHATQLKKLEAQNPYKRTWGREWAESIIFAVFAAAFIRMFLIEMYKIPTSSMEGSLLVGDFLCVSKVHYGIRTPMTIAMIPLLHNRIPFFDVESYLEKPSLDYNRLPAIENIEHNDPVVFNYPEGDSVIITPARTYSVYDIRRQGANIADIRQEIVTRPMDKMDHYIKRCIGLPGDSLKIIDRQVFINGVAVENPSNIQYSYIVRSQSGPLNMRKLQDWDINISDSPGNNIFMLNQTQIQKIESMGNVTVEVLPQSPRPLFPYDEINNKGWTVDNYGPIYIPRKGVSVPITPSTIAPYRRIIDTYEKNDLREENGKIYINGEEANSYTFKMDYYWMMGDNRHNSEDSRVWGFVPEDHVVGKPLFIWFSTRFGDMKNGIRWNRLFTGAKKF